MITKILKPTTYALNKAANLINDGELVAFATETVYGLSADATNDDAVKKIYVAKGRPGNNPLIVHLANKKDIKKYVKSINMLERKIIKDFMPGPISLVLKKNSLVSQIVSAGGDTIAVRIPQNKVARSFIRRTHKPICAPSANTSKRPSPTTAKHVFDDMNGKISLIIDGGQTDVGIESTVVKVENNEVYILRPGKINEEMLSSSLHCLVHENVKVGSKIESPGTKYTHYKPKCDMILVKNNIVENIKKITKMSQIRVKKL